jgi:DNA-binding CsgD family transcriptional regulator
VAASFGLARPTVYCHIDRIRQKLGVETLQELVALDLASDRP